MDQTNLLQHIIEFKKKIKPKTKEGKAKVDNIFDSVNALYEGREITGNTFSALQT